MVESSDSHNQYTTKYIPIVTKKNIISVVFIAIIFNLVMVFSPLNYHFKSNIANVDTARLHMNLSDSGGQITFLIATVAGFFLYYPFTWSLRDFWNRFVTHTTNTISITSIIFLLLFNPFVITWVWIPTAAGYY